MIRFFITALFFLLLTSCMAGVEKPVTSLVPNDQYGEEVLTNAYPSVDALCREVLKGLEQNDRKFLEALALDEQEVKQYIWPYDTHSRPEVNMPFEFWWGDLHKRSSFRLTQTLQRFGGKKFELMSVRFAEETMHYNDGKVHRDTRLTVKDEDGKEWNVEIFGSVFELKGRYKVFSYIYK